MTRSRFLFAFAVAFAFAFAFVASTGVSRHAPAAPHCPAMPALDS